ncbi:MAG: aminotransferase class III-fold pyridoxal phosphate-dependent enzyme [Acidobacteriota bacterium]
MSRLLTSNLGTLKETASEGYETHFSGSRALFRHRARSVLAGGTTHDGWLIQPFPVVIARAAGPFKWDVDGHQLIDYWMGHGALLMGHAFPPVVEAVTRQLSRGTHYGAPSELEIRWAELVCEQVPSAELVRFTSSGTEGTLLALRAVRAFTGRDMILKLDGHFHGWHDEALAHYVTPDSAGLNPGVVDNVVVGDPFDVEATVEVLETGQVAGVILEPGGGGSGGLPCNREFNARLHDACIRTGTLLIFDEVISGFRYSSGGAQQLYGILPDLTVLAKILAGGLPGGAVCGRREVMQVFGAGTRIGNRDVRLSHTGTFNGNPLSCSAGIAMLTHIADGKEQARAEQAARLLCDLVNRQAAACGVDVYLYNQSSTVHQLVGARNASVPFGHPGSVLQLYAMHPERYAALRRELLLAGVDMHPVHGWVSAVHDDDVIEATASAYGRAFARLQTVAGFELPTALC